MKLCRYDDDRLGVVRGNMVHDVTEAHPAYVSDRLKDRKIIATIFAGQEQKKWQGLFKDIFRPK